MIKNYTKDDIKIVWNNSICIHAGVCAKTLPQVFKPREKPWIQAENASKEDIISCVNNCPSGALSISNSND